MRLGIIDARLGLGGVEFIHFIQCPLRIPKLPRRRPEDVDGDGGEAVAEWLGLWAGVQDHAAGEACADFVAESADRAGVSTTEVAADLISIAAMRPSAVSSMRSTSAPSRSR